MTRRPSARTSSASRRTFLAAGAGSLAALGGLPAFTAAAAEPERPLSSPLVTDKKALRLWYDKPADQSAMIQQALPVGNGRLGALVAGDPGHEALYVTDSTLWTGGLNDVLDADGQFPYERVEFGSLTQLAHLRLDLSGHDLASVSQYRRTLDLSNGLVSTAYTHQGATCRREVFASHPDDVIVVRLSRSGGGSYTGTLTLEGTHGESVTTSKADAVVSFAASLSNSLRYGAAVTAVSSTGRVTVTDEGLAFDDCAELTIVFSGGTNYAPNASRGYRDSALDPRELARQKVLVVTRHAYDTLRDTHVRDHRSLFDTMSVSLGESSGRQRNLDTWSRLQARAQEGAEPDPELDVLYLQFGRYLMISGSRDSVPMGLQGPWLDGNDPDWMGDYHTDINIQMNYWMPDRTGLSRCFDPLTDYCLAQLPSWTDTTRRLFNDPRNRFRNTSGKVAGWAVAFSTNIHGGSGWWWHPAANAWLGNTLFEHYEYTQDRRMLARIYPLLKGACEFWEARLLSITVTDPETGEQREVLVDDRDWSPEHGPQDARGNTYSQELVHALFGNFITAAEILGQDAGYRETVAGLRERLYLPRISPTTGWLEEWMSPDNLGETTHRHLSPLIGLFPGDRIRPDASTPDLLDAVRSLLTARGMNSYGWANAWRALCWARLKDGEKAYQLVTTNLRPSTSNSNGTAPNLFDIYQVDANRSIFQIDANFGTPAAIAEMLLHSRPGDIELLPALPAAWAKKGTVRGLPARGGFTVDFSWSEGRVTRATVHSVGGHETRFTASGVARHLRVRPGSSVTLQNL
ncbi:glycosyl hydrolase family 95 catalytic domain-containing protein [Streptomyces sp. AF1B]|uniref:glycoside hydrolase family 95 protein n=1 Tax=Streptomyces sp. AF1B TaxID=3399503 RepID=UPI003AABCA99